MALAYQCRKYHYRNKMVMRPRIGNPMAEIRRVLSTMGLLYWVDCISLYILMILHMSYLHNGITILARYLKAKFMGPTWGPPGSCRPQMGPMLAPGTLLSGMVSVFVQKAMHISISELPLFQPKMILFLDAAYMHPLAKKSQCAIKLQYWSFCTLLPEIFVGLS